MESTIAATLFQYKMEYHGTVTLRQPAIIMWSFQIARTHNLWLPQMDAFVKPNITAVINLSGEICEALTR